MIRVVATADAGAARDTDVVLVALNGYVAERGAALGVPAPLNRTLRALVKLREEAPG